MMKVDRKLSIAPMMSYTDRHFRYFLRLALRHTLLYTEMVAANAMMHENAERLLAFDEKEHPIALQVAGCNPDLLAEASKIAEAKKYDEINLNIGCPSERVQAARFGVCLMKEPQLVADCVAAMKKATNIPVTVKCRVGVDDQDSDELLEAFTQGLIDSGVDALIVHARKAWLKGLSPKQNRHIPPINYERVYRLKQKFPDLEIIINGEIKTPEGVTEALRHVDGVMVGREAYNRPIILMEMERAIYGDDTNDFTISEWLSSYLPYIKSRADTGTPLSLMVRHILGVFQGRPGARKWRGSLVERSKDFSSGFKALQSVINEID